MPNIDLGALGDKELFNAGQELKLGVGSNPK